jgi:hypothetical protein
VQIVAQLGCVAVMAGGTGSCCFSGIVLECMLWWWLSNDGMYVVVVVEHGG